MILKPEQISYVTVGQVKVTETLQVECVSVDRHIVVSFLPK